MTVERLIEELQKLPPNTKFQDVTISARGEKEIDRVVWEGNHVVLEAGQSRG